MVFCGPNIGVCGFGLPLPSSPVFHGFCLQRFALECEIPTRSQVWQPRTMQLYQAEACSIIPASSQEIKAIQPNNCRTVPNTAWLGVAWPVFWRGLFWRGVTWCGVVSCGTVRLGLVWLVGVTWRGVIRMGSWLCFCGRWGMACGAWYVVSVLCMCG